VTGAKLERNLNADMLGNQPRHKGEKASQGVTETRPETPSDRTPSSILTHPGSPFDQARDSILEAMLAAGRNECQFTHGSGMLTWMVHHRKARHATAAGGREPKELLLEQEGLHHLGIGRHNKNSLKTVTIRTGYLRVDGPHCRAKPPKNWSICEWMVYIAGQNPQELGLSASGWSTFPGKPDENPKNWSVCEWVVHVAGKTQKPVYQRVDGPIR
jgi:hypothetical protein